MERKGEGEGVSGGWGGGRVRPSAARDFTAAGEPPAMVDVHLPKQRNETDT